VFRTSGKARFCFKLEAVTAYYRLSGLLPAEFCEVLSGARTQLDFGTSLVPGDLLAGALLLGFAAYRAELPSLGPAMVAAAMIAMGYALAVQLSTRLLIHVPLCEKRDFGWP
jgi:hypothetical protein